MEVGEEVRGGWSDLYTQVGMNLQTHVTSKNPIKANYNYLKTTQQLTFQHTFDDYLPCRTGTRGFNY